LFLDGLRGAAAFYVAVYHLMAWVPSVLPSWITHLQRPLSFGHVAVSIFIVLSGYSLGLPVGRSPERQLSGGFLGYLRRRARRILPAYYAATAISAGVVFLIARAKEGPSSSELSGGSIATHLLLIHNLWPSFTHTINIAHWSVGAEWQIYFLFPLFMIPVWRAAGPWAMAACGVLLAALPMALLPASLDLSWTCPWYIGLFAIGAAASSLERTSLSRGVRLALLGIVAVLGAAYLVVHHFSHRASGDDTAFEFAKDTIAGLVVALGLVLGVASSRDSGEKPLAVRFFESAPLLWLGRCSYSLYLIHCAVLNVCLFGAERLGLTDMGAFALRTFLGVPASLAVSYALYVTCERPFLRSREPRPVASRATAPLSQ
jgi:peptidoglycan/LPS O-acetylase OafA/YrhL